MTVVTVREDSLLLAMGRKQQANPGGLAQVLDKTLRNNGRGGGIRTRDPLLPKQMRYQAALRPEGVELYQISRNGR